MAASSCNSSELCSFDIDSADRGGSHEASREPMFMRYSSECSLTVSSFFPPTLRYSSKLVSEALDGQDHITNPPSLHTLQDAILNEETLFDSNGCVKPFHANVLPEMFSTISVEKQREANVDALCRHYTACARSLDRDVSFSAAVADLMECLAVITKTRSLVDDIGQAPKAFDITARFLSMNNAPFMWRSSPTLWSSAVSPVFTTSDMREHAIMLAWRVALLSARKASELLDVSMDGRMMLEKIDSEIEYTPSTTSDVLKRSIDECSSLLMYSLVMLQQVIPAQMEARAGSIENWSLYPCALAVPEMRPKVVSAITKTILAMFHMCVCIRIIRFKLKGPYPGVTDSELPYMAYTHMMDKGSTPDRLDLLKRTERRLCSKSVQSMVSVEEIESVNGIRCLILMLCTDAIRELETHAWGTQLDYPLLDFKEKTELQSSSRIYSSGVHKRMLKWLKTIDEHRDDTSCAAVLRNSAPARSLRFFLFGSAVYMECLMMAKHLSDIDLDDAKALPTMSILAQKIENLLAPVTGRRRCAVELMVWLLDQVNDRAAFCAHVAEYVINDHPQIVQQGLGHSRAPLFLGRRAHPDSGSFLDVVDKSRHDPLEDDQGHDLFDHESSGAPSAHTYDGSMGFAGVLRKRLVDRLDSLSRDEDSYNLTPEELRRRRQSMRFNPITGADLNVWVKLVGCLDFVIGSRKLQLSEDRQADDFPDDSISLEHYHEFGTVTPISYVPGDSRKMYEFHLKSVISKIEQKVAVTSW